MSKTDWTFSVGIVGDDDKDIQDKADALSDAIMRHEFVTDVMDYEEEHDG